MRVNVVSIIKNNKIDVNKLEPINDVVFNESSDALTQLGECKAEVKKVEICRGNVHKVATATNALIGGLWHEVNQIREIANKAEMKAQTAIERHEKSEEVIRSNTEAMHSLKDEFSELKTIIYTFCKTVMWCGIVVTGAIGVVATIYGMLK